MVEDLENHPAIVTWVLFNEGWGQYDTERPTQWLKALDPSRLVNNASGWTDMRVGDVVDIHSYPGRMSRPRNPGGRRCLGSSVGWIGRGWPFWSSRCWGYLMLPDSGTGARYTRAFKQVWALHNYRG